MPWIDFVRYFETGHNCSNFGCTDLDATQCEEVGDAGVLDAQWINSGSYSSTSGPRACYLKLSGMKLYYNTVQPPLRNPPPPL